MQTYTVGGQVVKLCVTDEVSPYPAAAAAVVTIETRRLASSTVNSIIITSSSSSSSSRIQTLAFYSCRCLTNRVSRRPFQSRVPRLDRAQVVCFLRRIQIARAEKKNPEWIWKNILFFLKKEPLVQSSSSEDGQIHPGVWNLSYGRAGMIITIIIIMI